MVEKEYVEREAVLSRLRFKRDSDIFPRKKFAGIECAIAQVKKTPAADVVEVRHGEWVDYETDEPYGYYDTKAWYKCSVCGKNAHGRCPEDEWYSSPILSDYCPFCGAKMDGKGEGK